MKNISRRIVNGVIVVCAALGIFSLATLSHSIMGPAKDAIRRIDAADQDTILAACRQIMNERPQYTNDLDPTVTWMEEWVTVKRGSHDYRRRLPAAVRDLNPYWVLIGTDQVVVSVNPIPARVYLRAFSPKAKQFGSRKLIDGLWILN